MPNNFQSKDQPFVSVIMNCYNGERYLREAIESVYAQTYPNWEIIFWDNASTDNSERIAKSFDSKLHYFLEERTITLGAARNKALSKCNGDYIAFLDVDDLWLPKKLEKQIIKMSSKIDNVICYSDGFLIHGSNKSNKKFSSSKNIRFYEGHIFNQLIRSNFIYWQTVLINRKLAGSNLKFNEKLSYAEDHEILLRMSLIGKITFSADPLIFYRIHNNNMSYDHELIVKESEIIFKLFNKEIQDRKIKIRKAKSLLYGSIILNSIKAEKEFEKYIKFLIIYPSIQNILLYFIIRLKLIGLLKLGLTSR